MQREMHQQRDVVHEWGATNRVQFEPSKEAFVVIYPINGSGEDFRMLGCVMDCKLLMHSAIDAIAKKVRPKIKNLLRMRAFYSVEDLVLQYKTHILPILECHNGAIFHAADSHLAVLDRLQHSFIHALGMTEATMFLEHNLAPLRLRRDIAILGLLHKCNLGQVHPLLCRLFRGRYRPNFTFRARRHNKPLHTHIEGVRYLPGLYQRSLFNMANIYNMLPQAFLDMILWRVCRAN